MSEFVIFDTSVLVDRLRSNRHAQRMNESSLLVRYSSVVLAELLRGATEAEERKFVAILTKSRFILTPTTKNWLESGEILARINADEGFQPAKLRDLHFDVLIALTARVHGAKVITSNRADFELIRKYRKFELEVW